MSSIDLPKSVKYCVMTEEMLYDLWEHLKGYDKLFDDDTRGEWNWFFERVTAENTIMLEVPGGMLTLTGLRPGLLAQVHVSFWDHKLSARADLLKECIEWAFLEFNLWRLEALIPSFCRALKRFLEDKMGFSYEGRMRDRMFYKGELSDVLVYSLLRKEVS